MKKLFTAFAFLLLNFSCFSQTIQELEHELSFYKVGEKWGNKKDIAYQLLAMDSFNGCAVNYLVEVYASNNQKDSISALFNRLIKENPNRPEPFLLLAQERNAYLAGLTYTQQISNLKEACKLDSVNIEAIYLLGKLHYKLFIDEYTTAKQKSNLDTYATSAIKHFTTLCRLNENFKETLKYPLLQLANYEGDINKSQLYESFKVQASFFPIAAFVNFPSDWQTNYSVNVIDFAAYLAPNVEGIESALFRINWYSSKLDALDEPVLSDSLPSKVFRFTWLRTFHDPIVIGLLNSNDSISLYWKVGDEAGKTIEYKEKTLKSKEWDDFVATIDSIYFWNLPTTESEILGNDGAQWILEGKEFGKYHVVDRWSGGIIKQVCLKLLEITDLKIAQKDIY